MTSRSVTSHQGIRVGDAVFSLPHAYMGTVCEIVPVGFGCWAFKVMITWTWKPVLRFEQLLPAITPVRKRDHLKLAAVNGEVVA